MLLVSMSLQGYFFIRAGEMHYQPPTRLIVVPSGKIFGVGFNTIEFIEQYGVSEGAIQKLGTVLKAEGYWVLTFVTFILIGALRLLIGFIVRKVKGIAL